MNRREFSRVLGGAAALVGVQQPAADLYSRALVFDCNSFPPYENGRLPLTQSDLDIVRGSGINLIKASLGGINADFAEAVKSIAYFQRLIEFHPEYFLQVRTPPDIDRAKREGKLGIILSFESTEMLEGKLDSFDLFRNLGVRVMQLSYNRRSPFGAGVMEPEAGGLTALGRQAVHRMNALGITIDLSHANERTTSDAVAASSKPVILSHAGCAAVHAHPRNKTDAQLRMIADKGGVVGIYDLPYLTASPKQPTVDDYIAHMEHALKVAGEEHVGIGSDVWITPFDTSPKGMAEYQEFEEKRQKSGLAAPEEDRPPYVIGLNSARRMETIADQLLKRGQPARMVEKILGANFARVMRDTWTG